MTLRLTSALSGLLIAFASCALGAPVEGTDYVELKPPSRSTPRARSKSSSSSGTAAPTAMRSSRTSSPG
jgi:hypothetical protein